MTERRIPNLTDAQADGLACVACHVSLLAAPAGTRWVPVGRSVTDSQVMACVGKCADRYKESAVTA